MNKHKDLHKDASFNIHKTFLFYDSGPSCRLVFEIWEIDEIGRDDRHKEETNCDVGERSLDLQMKTQDFCKFGKCDKSHIRIYFRVNDDVDYKKSPKYLKLDFLYPIGKPSESLGDELILYQ